MRCMLKLHTLNARMGMFIHVQACGNETAWGLGSHNGKVIEKAPCIGLNPLEDVLIFVVYP